MHRRKISNFLIYPQFQLSLLFVNIIILALVLLIIHFNVNDIFNQLNFLGEKNNFDKLHPYFEFVEKSRNLMNTRLNLAFGASAILTIFITIFISHKMVGPIYKLKNFLFAVNNGEKPEKLEFRKGDFFSDLPELVNQTLEKTRNDG
jgi:hypothetical protein